MIFAAVAAAGDFAEDAVDVSDDDYSLQNADAAAADAVPPMLRWESVESVYVECSQSDWLSDWTVAAVADADDVADVGSDHADGETSWDEHSRPCTSHAG